MYLVHLVNQSFSVKCWLVQLLLVVRLVLTSSK